jgi:amicyanin
MKLKSVVFGLAAIALLAAGCNSNVESTTTTGTDAGETRNETPAQTTPTTGTDISVDAKSGTVTADIQNFAFSPTTLTVKKGTTVTWTNRDSVKHDVMSDTNDPNGPKGPLLAQNETYSYTFDKAGTYPYHCTPHPRMKAVVEVVE